ncbi:ABC transporter ATP-binding protein [Nocardia carnea]|uniref:ABC transporter ATP-binding protein n=1 Tax=Nocardia carnea TaxID=37328 RepID=UPI002458B9FD|nr:ABC transporter ATP-binding protein [Nocardia carnea]
MSDSTAHIPDVVLEARGLTVEFDEGRRVIRPVDGVDITLRRGQMLGLVGESGSGKSVTSLAITGLTDYTGGRIVSGSVRLGDIDMLALTPKQRSTILGRDIGMIFQQPRRSLNPTMSVGGQIAEAVRRHRGLSRKEAWARAVEMLDRVRIPDAARRAHEMPFSFSGGMAQRVMIAMALVCEPSVLIADEPTTALDATVQARVMELLAELQHDLDVAVLLITHDLGVASGTCDRISVMYCGQIVEEGPTADVLVRAAHPYTKGLLAASPRRGGKGRLVPIPGSVPPSHAIPAGCRFHPRCPVFTRGACDSGTVDLVPRGPDRADRCVHPGADGRIAPTTDRTSP